MEDAILFILLLPINIPFAILDVFRGGMFYLLGIEYLKDDVRCLQLVQSRHTKKLIDIEKTLAHIETNLMYDASPDEIKKQLDEISPMVKILVSEHNKKVLKEVDDNYDVVDLGHIKAETLGTKTAVAEKEQLRDVENDYKRETRLVNEKIAKRAKEDERAFVCTTEDINC